MDLGSYNYDNGSASVGDKETTMGLNWRLDPEKSFSDWTIVVSQKSPRDFDSYERVQCQKKKRISFCGQLTRTYHVHKNILGAGMRKSEYFSKLFRLDGLAESVYSTSRIELNPSAAAAFPAMLDFVYSNDDVEASPETAVALRYLSNYFGIRDLFDRANRFIENNLSLSSALTYLGEAAIYNDEKISNAMIDFLAANFEKIDGDVFAELPADLFNEIVSSPLLKCESTMLSSRVATFCKFQPKAVNNALLRSVTRSDKMHSIHPNSALFLMQLGIEHSLDGTESKMGPSLHERCLCAAANSWEDLVLCLPEKDSSSTKAKRTREKKRKHAMADIGKDYADLSCTSKLELLESALHAAYDEVSCLKQKGKEHSQQNERELNELQQRIRESDQMIHAMQKKINGATSVANSYASQLQKYIKLPVAQTFCSRCTCRTVHACGNSTSTALLHTCGMKNNGWLHFEGPATYDKTELMVRSFFSPKGD